MVNREELKAKYGDENVFVVKKSIIDNIVGNRELVFNNDSKKVLIKEIDDNGYFIPRWQSDENPDEVEIIPYIVICDKVRNIWTYKRIKNGDIRGNGKFSIGIGGHVNDTDKAFSDCTKTWIKGAIREIKEETNKDILEPNKIFVSAIIRMTNSDFNKDHLGLVILAKCDDLSKMAENTSLGLGYFTKEYLQLEIDKFEDWSKIIIENYDLFMY